MKQAKVSDLIKALQKHLEEDGDLPVRLMLLSDTNQGATFTAPLVIYEEELDVIEEDYSMTFEPSVVLMADETGQSENDNVTYKVFKGE